MWALRWLLGAALFVALVFLSLDNAEPVTVRLFRSATWQAPLAFVVLCTFAAGVAVGVAVGALRNARLKRQLRRMRREVSRGMTAPAPHGAVPGQVSPTGQPPFGIG